MKMSVVRAMKQKAAENFKFKDASFVDFEEISLQELSQSIESEQDIEDFSVQLDVIANMKIAFEGNPPDSYRVLNGMIQDWVDDHDEDLKKVINPKLIPYLKEHYKNIDVSDITEDFDDYIWEDQVDYMPDIDESKKEIQFSIELVIEIEESEEDDE
jgi:hypothetical protein